MSLLHWTWMQDRLLADIDGCKTILDAGCGKETSLKNVKAYKVGVDIFPDYIREAKSQYLHDDYVCMDILQYLTLCADKSFDAVFFGSVIEHIEKNKAKKAIERACLVAKKKVIIVTTNGFIRHQEIDENPYQSHKSGWSVDDFEKMGFKVYGGLGWKPFRGEAGVTKIKPVVLGEIISNLTEYWTYKHPKQAFILYAVKDSAPEDRMSVYSVRGERE